MPNIDAISGALFTLTIQYEYTQTQCDEGARDGIDIWYMGIRPKKHFENQPQPWTNWIRQNIFSSFYQEKLLN